MYTGTIPVDPGWMAPSLLVTLYSSIGILWCLEQQLLYGEEEKKKKENTHWLKLMYQYVQKWLLCLFNIYWWLYFFKIEGDWCHILSPISPNIVVFRLESIRVTRGLGLNCPCERPGTYSLCGSARFTGLAFHLPRQWMKETKCSPYWNWREVEVIKTWSG